MLDKFIDGLALLETAGGKKTIKGPNGEDSFNLFNIKEFRPGREGYRAYDKAEKSRDAYRVYANYDEAKEDLKALFARKYPAALTAQTAEEFAQALKSGGYATDPLYVSKLTKVINSSAGLPTTATTALPPLDENGPNGDLIRVARERGYSDKEIATKLQANSKAIADAGKVAASTALKDSDPTAVVFKLKENPELASLIEVAKERGYSDSEIAAKLGGEEYAKAQAAIKTTEGKGVLSRVASGVGYAVDDLKAGANQLFSRVTGNDGELAQQQATQAAAEQDYDRQAVLNSTAGKVGNIGAQVVPNIALGVVSGGSSIPAQVAAQGAIGAASGALRPTTEDGQFGQNIAMSGGLGALGGGAGAAIAKAPQVLVRSGQAALRGGQSVEDTLAIQAARQAEGIQSGAADLSSRAAQLSNKIGDNIIGSRAFGADKTLMREPEIARAITRQIGNESDELSAGVVRQAQQQISKLYDDALDGVNVSLPRAFDNQLDSIIAKNASSSLPSLSSGLPQAVAADLKTLAANGPVSARQLQGIRSRIGAELATNNDQGAKAALGEIRSTLDDAIEQNLPTENLAKFRQANEQYRKLQVVENYGRRTNYSGDEFSAKKFLASIKAENKKSFERGEAPFQELANALAVGGGSSRGSDLLKLGGLYGAMQTGGGSILAGNLAQRVLTDPKYANALLGLNPVARAQLMRQAGMAYTGGAVGAETTKGMKFDK